MKVIKIKKILFVILIILSLIRYYNLNGNFKINTYSEIEIYPVEEFVDFNDDYCEGGKRYLYLSARVNDAVILGADEYLNKYFKETHDNSLNKNSKFCVVDVDFKNNEDNPICISLENFEILGKDWYKRANFEQTYILNITEFENTDDFEIELSSEETKKIQMVYELCEPDFKLSRFKNIESEEITLELTVFPRGKRILLEV